MVLADSQKQFLLHLESYLEYEKEHEVGQYLLLVVFIVSTLKQVLNNLRDYALISQGSFTQTKYLCVLIHI